MTADLKPCPFCGSAPELRSSHGWYAVGCYTAKCPASIHALTHRSESAAVATWNTRAPGVTATVKESLTAGAPEPQASEHCTWMQDGEADGTWFTDCGHAFNLEAGAPAENKMKFCCYCGKPTRAPGVRATSSASAESVTARSASAVPTTNGDPE